MNPHLCCIDKCLLDVLKQKVCKKQYAGKTVDRFRLRYNNYVNESDRKFLRNEEIKQISLHGHFLETIITALKKMLASVSLINLTLLTLIKQSIAG